MRTDEYGKPCPGTLGEYRDLILSITREDNRAIKYLDKRIAQSRGGRDEGVYEPDSQMRALLFNLLEYKLVGVR